ncbi:MAG: hypothetical protein AB7F75_06310 [Planctomycetota bacterium]
METDQNKPAVSRALRTTLMVLASAVCGIFSLLFLLMGLLGLLFKRDDPQVAMDYKVPLFSGIALLIATFMIVRRLIRKTSGADV